VNRGQLPRDGKGAYLWLDYNAVAAGKQRMPEKPEGLCGGAYSALHKFEPAGIRLDCGWNFRRTFLNGRRFETA